MLALPIQVLALILVLRRSDRPGVSDGIRCAGATILALVVTGKVLSPQFIIWLIPFVAALPGGPGGRARRRFFLTCLSTSILFPWGALAFIVYPQLSGLRLHGAGVLLLNYRNAFCWSCCINCCAPRVPRETRAMSASVLDEPARGKAKRWLAPIGLVPAAAVLAWSAHRVMGRRFAGDFLCYWTAARVLVGGGNPYAPEPQRSIQRALGWDRATMGFGIWDYLPFNHPPWVELFALPLLPLGYPAARFAWVALGFLAIAAAGWLSRDLYPGLRSVTIPILVVTFLPATLAAGQAQTTPLVFLALMLGGRLLREGYGRAAGVALAWASIKPHLAAIPLAGLCLWGWRRREWGLLRGVCGMLLALGAASALALPRWPVDMLGAIRRSPVPTVAHPEVGCTWPLVLRACRVAGWPYGLAYAVLALPALAAVLRLALSPSRPAGDVLAACVLATFFVTPYGRLYDYVLLLLPLLGAPEVRRRPAWLLAAFLMPWIFLGAFGWIEASRLLPGVEMKLYTFFWLPVAIAALWLAPPGPDRQPSPVPGEPATGI